MKTEKLSYFSALSTKPSHFLVSFHIKVYKQYHLVNDEFCKDFQRLEQ